MCNLFDNFLLPKKLQTQNLGREKLRKILLCKKAARKLFVKLPPIVQFINILRAAFFTISFFGKNHKNKMKVEKTTFVQKSCS